MEYIKLNNGVQMPVLGLGTYQLHGIECEQCIVDAVNMGYRLFDTAQMYGNEKELGNAIIKCNVPREELFITTKLYSPSTSYERTKVSIKESLKALQLDYIDLLLIHEPYHEAKEMYRAMEEAYRDGLVRAIGISNFNSAQYIDFIQSCHVIPVINQVEAHVFYQQKDIQELILEHGTQMTAWSPFAVGKGDFFRNITLKSIGEKYGKSAAQIGLKHLVQRGIVVIPKTAGETLG